MEQITSWVAPIATTIAALMTASNLGSRVTGWGFVVFTIGSLAWLSLGIATGQSNLLWQNIILTALNLFGIWRWLGRQAKLEDGGKKAAEASQAKPGETLFPVSLLPSAKVETMGGAALGASVDAMASSRGGRLVYCVVTSGGVGGVGEEFRKLDWSTITVDGDRLRSSLDEAKFAALAPVAKDDWR